MNKLVKTEFGYVEDEALAALQDEFDTMAVLECVEKVETLRGELGRLHSELMGLHSMAGYAGGFLGPLGVGLILDLAGGDGVLGWGLAFGHLAIVTLAGLVVLRWLGRAR